jgi:large subunit ribosomal protein L18
MSMQRKDRRLRRAAQTRIRIRERAVARLTVHRSAQHIYAQVIDGAGAKVLAAASTVQEDLRGTLKGTGNIAAAQAVGRAIAEKAKAAGVTRVAFDRSGFQYHGRVKALAEAARESGLEF